MPKKTTKADKENLLQVFENSSSTRWACKRVGIGKSTFYRWLQEDTNFKERINKIRNKRRKNRVKLRRLMNDLVRFKKESKLFSKYAQNREVLNAYKF